MTIKRSLQHSCKQLRHRESQQQADNECASLESAKKKRAERDSNEQWLPNCAIAERGHQQVEHRIRPAFVNEMKETLVQLVSFKCCSRTSSV